jgi:heme/copper-type cytochrome/quinol oxidase subunit 3
VCSSDLFAFAVTSLRQGARNRIFMSVVVSRTLGPVFVKMAKQAALSAMVMSSPP